jgi:hypothetical protein
MVLSIGKGPWTDMQVSQSDRGAMKHDERTVYQSRKKWGGGGSLVFFIGNQPICLKDKNLDKLSTPHSRCVEAPNFILETGCENQSM